MASHSAFAIFMLLVVVPTATLATTYMVGDESGWTVGFDYQAWAQDKNFQVGDKLVFWYPKGNHNVFRVNGTAFHNCTIPPLVEALTTGNDTITLATSGNKWYICGVGQHCASGGQKLAITVHSYAPTPSPSMAPSPLSPIPYAYGGSDVADSEYDTPAPSPVEFAPWEYATPAPSPVEFAPWEYATPAPSPVELATWEYGTPPPVESAPSKYFTPAPSPVEFAPWEYATPAPSPVELATWEYGTPAPPPVESAPWKYFTPAPSPDADTGYTEKAAKKRPFINFFRE